jgi:hypothetical protein
MDIEDIPDWGGKSGNQAVGDTLRVPKHQDTIRFHYQNVNGVTIGQGGTWEGVCENWKHMEVDVGLVCEHKLDTTHFGVNKGLREGATRIFGTGCTKLVAGSTNRVHGKHFKPGGVLATTIGAVTGRVMAADIDE